MSIERIKTLILAELILVLIWCLIWALLPMNAELVLVGISSLVVAMATVALVFVTWHHADVAQMMAAESQRMTKLAVLAYEPIPYVQLDSNRIDDKIEIKVLISNLGDYTFRVRDVRASFGLIDNNDKTQRFDTRKLYDEHVSREESPKEFLLNFQYRNNMRRLPLYIYVWVDILGLAKDKLQTYGPYLLEVPNDRSETMPV